MDSMKFKEALKGDDYKAQGEEFLKMTGTEIAVKFIENGKHFDDDKETRDIYNVTIKRGSRQFSFRYGQSFNASGKYISMIYAQCKDGTIYNHKKGFNDIKHFRLNVTFDCRNSYMKNRNFAEPNAYSILACLTKCDPETFEDFCGNYGYDIDSRKAEKTYRGVVEEYKNVAMLFNDNEIELMQEIN